MLAGPMFVCWFVRPCIHECVYASFTKYKIMYCKQPAGPRNANFCIHMNVDKLPSPANFHSNPQRP